MSLYRFFENSIEENPEVIYQYNYSSYNDIYEHQKKKVT